MRKLHRFFKFTFLYLQLRFDLWKIEREIRRGIHFDLTDFPKDNDLIIATQEFWGNKYKREVSRNEAVNIITNLRNFIKVLLSDSKEDSDE